MKLAPIAAMLLIALDCFAMGLGVEEQNFFADSLVWLWLVVGFYWVLTAVIFYYE